MTGYAFTTPFDEVQHFAFVHGRIGDGRGVPVRLHRADIVKDVLGGNAVVNRSLERFATEGRGVLVYLRDGTAGVPVSSVGAEGSESKRFSNGARSGSGRRSCATSGSGRSSCCPRPSAPMWGCPASASRSRRRKPSATDADAPPSSSRGCPVILVRGLAKGLDFVPARAGQREGELQATSSSCYTGPTRRRGPLPCWS